MSTTTLPGSYRQIRRDGGVDRFLDGEARRERRVRRILSSIHRDLDEGGRAYLRPIPNPCLDLFRLEIERPDMSYQRITILDAETLETLLEETGEQRIRESFDFDG